MLLTERSSLYSHVISVLLALWVTHSSGKLNVKHHIYCENKKILDKDTHIHLETYFYSNQYIPQFILDRFKYRLITAFSQSASIS